MTVTVRTTDPSLDTVILDLIDDTASVLIRCALGQTDLDNRTQALQSECTRGTQKLHPVVHDIAGHADLTWRSIRDPECKAVHGCEHGCPAWTRRVNLAGGDADDAALAVYSNQRYSGDCAGRAFSLPNFWIIPATLRDAVSGQEFGSPVYDNCGVRNQGPP